MKFINPNGYFIGKEPNDAALFDYLNLAANERPAIPQIKSVKVSDLDPGKVHLTRDRKTKELVPFNFNYKVTSRPDGFGAKLVKPNLETYEHVVQMQFDPEAKDWIIVHDAIQVREGKDCENGLGTSSEVVLTLFEHDHRYWQAGFFSWRYNLWDSVRQSHGRFTWDIAGGFKTKMQEGALEELESEMGIVPTTDNKIYLGTLPDNRSIRALGIKYFLLMLK
ncbi:hypothetical protein HGB07_08715, partial [Candidatus Roizmanbacteria bacterium]|nr:hypothetical protein [Candidatus Roizmanbacteria bacterium]